MRQGIIGGKGARARKAASGEAVAAISDDASAPLTVRHVTVQEDGAGQRLDNYLLKTLKGVPKTHVYRIIRSGEVRVNRGRAAADTRLAHGDALRLPPVRSAAPRDERAAPPREFPIVFEDEQLLAIDKPAGVAVHGGSGVAFGVIEQLRRARPQARFLELVHRLDRETSGLLLVAKKRSTLADLQRQFRARTIDKTYAALVVGAWPANQKVIDVPLHKYLDAAGERRVRAAVVGQTPLRRPPGDRSMAPAEEGKRSITLVRVLKHFEHYSLLDVTIKTGRTHQIRVHLAHAGHPIVGDEKYGDFALNKALAHGTPQGLRLGRMFLHARRLAFDHPAAGSRLELQAPLPADCEALLQRLGEPL